MNRVLDRAAFVVALASIAILGAAFAFQYIGKLAPCELCILQRWPYVATIALGLLGLWAGRMRQPALTRGLLALAGLVHQTDAQRRMLAGRVSDRRRSQIAAESPATSGNHMSAAMSVGENLSSVPATAMNR